jgi:HKD family nuclease
VIIDDARVAERFAAVRPGYKLLACESGALPYFLITAPVLLQQKMPVAPIDEFVLRGINQGLSSVELIASFLGLEEDLVTLSLSRLWQNDFVDMPVATAGRELRLTSLGLLTLSNLLELVPSEQEVWFPFDRLLWKAVPFSAGALLRPKDVEQQGLLVIKPRMLKKPEVIDLPARDVDRSIKESMKNVLIDADVLVVKRIERAEQKYLPCHVLVYESLDGTDHVIEISIDGRLRPDIRNAIDALGGVSHFGFDFASSAFTSSQEIQPVLDAAAQVKIPIVPLEVVDDVRRQANATPDGEPKIEVSDIDTGRPVVIENMEVRHIDTFEHPMFLTQAITEAKTRLLITSPWVTRAVVRKEFMDKLYSAAKRGVQIHIGYGIDYEAKDCHVDALEKLEKLANQFENVYVACLGSTHAKILIWDKNEIITSFNWLSFRGDKDRTYRQEHGVLLRNQGNVTEANWSEQKEWIERVASKGFPTDRTPSPEQLALVEQSSAGSQNYLCVCGSSRAKAHLFVSCRNCRRIANEKMQEENRN